MMDYPELFLATPGEGQLTGDRDVLFKEALRLVREERLEELRLVD